MNETTDRKTFKQWLEDEIRYLESIDRTEFGDGRLAALKAVREVCDD